jgi:glycosyltransferase involved in cell wall biosynthesis
MKQMPRVSVLLPSFNSEQYLRQAIQSILQQTYEDLELIVISEHGTSSESIGIVNEFKDQRIVHIINKERLGLELSLNLAANLARGEYLARMDADDIALRDRIRRQVDFLDSHPDIGVLGTAVEIIDRNGRRLGRLSYPSDAATASLEMFFRCHLAGSTVLIRKELFLALGGYPPQAKYGEDYLLWLAMAERTGTCSLPSVLLQYRWHGRNKSTIDAEEQERLGKLVAEFAGMADEDYGAFKALTGRSLIVSPGEAIGAARLMERLRSMRMRVARSWKDRLAYDVFSSRIWISLAMRRGGWRESAQVMLLALSSLGPIALIAFPLGGISLMRFRKQQRRFADIRRAV